MICVSKTRGMFCEIEISCWWRPVQDKEILWILLERPPRPSGTPPVQAGSFGEPAGPECAVFYGVETTIRNFCWKLTAEACGNLYSAELKPQSDAGVFFSGGYYYRKKNFVRTT
jgi:hypothetical protein